MKSNGNVVPRRSLWPLTTAEIHSPTEIKRREVFDRLIYQRHGDSVSLPKEETYAHANSNNNFEAYEDDVEAARHIPETEDTVDANGRLINQQPAYDKMINQEVMLQQDGETVSCTVKRHTI